jgi:hypothetical protein
MPCKWGCRKAILNAAVVARKCDKRNREERAQIAAGQSGQMAHSRDRCHINR